VKTNEPPAAQTRYDKTVLAEAAVGPSRHPTIAGRRTVTLEAYRPKAHRRH